MGFHGKVPKSRRLPCWGLGHFFHEQLQLWTRIIKRTLELLMIRVISQRVDGASLCGDFLCNSCFSQTVVEKAYSKTKENDEETSRHSSETDVKRNHKKMNRSDNVLKNIPRRISMLGTWALLPWAASIVNENRHCCHAFRQKYILNRVLNGRQTTAVRWFKTI